jgi:ethanolaminephosphotransferase
LVGVQLLLEKRGMGMEGEGEKDEDEDEGGERGTVVERKGGEGLWKGHVAVLTVFVAGSVAAVMAACTVLRTHLFVWTVFSPKYLYCVAWSLGQHLGVNVLVGGVVYWLGVWEGR